MKYSYNWLKWYIPDAPEPEKLADIFTYHLAEVENLEKLPDGDTVFEIKILPNRAHDLLSHMGLARELASLLNISYTDPTPKYKIPDSKPGNLKIEIATEKCRRYMGRVVRNVKVGPSPEWVVKHLEAIGQRSINNMVDASNIVMFNCGQPTHVFDMRKMQLDNDAPFIKIDIAKNTKEKFLTTLDKRQINFRGEEMLIIDKYYDQPLALAGIKGGDKAEVDESTTDVILEVANFDPTSVRKTAQSFNLFTDARKRFENDLSPELGEYAMRELSALIAEMCPSAEFEDVVDEYPVKQAEQKMSFRADKVRSVLGLEVSNNGIEGILKRYNFPFTEKKGVYEIAVPPLRLDLALEEDMAEEIGRVLGYDKINGSIPKVNFQPKQNDTYAKIIWARNKLLSEGYSEVMTTSFKNKGKVSVLASASDKNFLRTDLADGLKESLKLNKNNLPILGSKEVKIFEIGTVWAPEEEMHVAYNEKDKIIEKGLEEFCKSASPDAFSQVLGSPMAQPDHSQKHAGSAFSMWPLYPFIARDIAVWVPEGVSSAEVLKVIKENAGDMVIRGPELFDEFKKDGKVSYAFRAVFQSYDRTLTDAEVNEIMQKIAEKIAQNGWQVR